MLLLSVDATVVWLAVVVFLLVVLLLVAVLLYARRRLVPAGKVKLSINEGQKVLDVERGNSLLSTLVSQNIFLPSACGGGGTLSLIHI